MTATPRQLSDAVQADHDEILASHDAWTRPVERWTLVRTISGWTALAIAITVFATLVLSALTGSLVSWILFLLLFIATPVIVVPAAVLWVVSVITVSHLRARLGEKVYALYGITVDRTVEPAVYSVGNLPVSWLKPELHRTRALLLSSDLGPVAAEQ